MIGWLQTKWFSWGLGITGAVAFGLWMALSSRIPAIGLLAVVMMGLIARQWAIKLAPKPVPLTRQLVGFAVANAEYLALGAILLLASGLRFAGISQSLPYVDNPDEPTATLTAIKMLQSGDLNPHFFRWSNLIFYTQFALSLPQFLAGVGGGQFNSLQNITTDGFYLVGRLLSAILGVATIGLVWFIGRKLYNGAVGLLAAFILSIMPLHSEHSKYVTPDIMVTFFATLTLLCAVYIYQTGQRKWYLWAGIAAGLATGTKYNVAIVVGLVVLAHFLADKTTRGKFIWILQSLGVAVVVFFLTTPFAIVDLTGFLNELAFQIIHYTIEGHGGEASTGSAWSAYLRYLYNEVFVGLAIIVLIGAILVALIRQKREDWLVLALPAAGYLFFSAAKTHFARNLLPLLPPLAILSALCLILAARIISQNLWFSKQHFLAKKEGGLAKSSISWGIIVVLLTLVFFSLSIRNSILTTRYYLQPDTRVVAGKWIVENLPAGTRLRLEQGAPYLPNDRYRDSEQRRPIGGRALEWYKAEGFDYLVAVSYQYKDLSATDPQAAENYRTIFNGAKLLKEFIGDNADYPGPTIRIYAVK